MTLDAVPNSESGAGGTVPAPISTLPDYGVPQHISNGIDRTCLRTLRVCVVDREIHCRHSDFHMDWIVGRAFRHCAVGNDTPTTAEIQLAGTDVP